MKELKALEILKEGLDFMNQAIKVNPNSIKELQSEIDRYVEAIDEFEELNNKSCENCKRRKACKIWDNAGIPIDSLKDFCCIGWKSKVE